MGKILIAMSGGVDSSVAAALLKQEGNTCLGVMLRLYENEDAGLSRESACCSASDAEDARAVASRLGMPFYVFNFTEYFREEVLGRFARCYACGRTPNPCIDCNRYMKFGRLYERARVLGCDAVATGHYARVEKTEDGWVLKKALDGTKDQSYVLYRLTQDELAHTRFPLGSLRKTETRALAERFGLVTARKRDSQDICFAPDGDYAAAVERCLGRTFPPGPFVRADGTVLGEHRGLIRYTVGQRRGLGLPSGGRLYVTALRPEENAVVVGGGDELLSRTLEAEDFHWISGKTPPAPFRAKAKIRYHHPEAACTVTPGERVTVVFDEPQRAAAPGQSVVLYDGDVVLGGGTIVSGG